MKTDNILTLPDGRKLAYAEFGKPDGYPLLYCHASPSSRLEPLFLGDDIVSQLGLRVICPDRPGMGAEALRLDQFSVLVVSGGGGYAAVCAAKIPERLCKVVIASGAWRIDSEALKSIGFPMNLMWLVTIRAPFLLPFVLKVMTKMMSQTPKSDPEQASALPNKKLPAADRAVMAEPGRIAINQRILSEVMRQGVKGPAWDYRLCVREWDFDLAEIQIPLTLIHGEQDRNYPLALAQRVANSLPRSQLLIYPREGHISTYINHFDEVAEALMPD
jgi:pimeloyl-ACP methyl ester carboxylesterase